MAQQIVFEKGRISNFERLVTFTLTLDLVILHTVIHHSSTTTYTPNFIKIKKPFCGRTDVCIHMYVCMYVHGQTLETGFIRSTLSKSRPKNEP